jgi:hypothetical protein
LPSYLGRNTGLEGALPFDLRHLTRLHVLLHDDTGLCASPSPDFQAWYAAVEQTAGAICNNPEQITVFLPMVYLTQSVRSRTMGPAFLEGVCVSCRCMGPGWIVPRQRENRTWMAGIPTAKIYSPKVPAPTSFTCRRVPSTPFFNSES